MYGDYTCLVRASPAQPPGRIPSCCWCGSEIQRPPRGYTALSWEKVTTFLGSQGGYPRGDMALSSPLGPCSSPEKHFPAPLSSENVKALLLVHGSLAVLCACYILFWL